MINTINDCCGTHTRDMMRARYLNRFAGYDYSPNDYFSGFRPRTDISEDNENLYFEFELPGIDQQTLKVSLNDENILSISGEKKSPESENIKKTRNERFFGNFERNFQLPDNVTGENIKASYENGILTITVPKKKPEVRNIEIG